MDLHARDLQSPVSQRDLRISEVDCQTFGLHKMVPALKVGNTNGRIFNASRKYKRIKDDQSILCQREASMSEDVRQAR